MVLYRRNRVPGGTYFFTVTLADRRSDLLVTHVDAFRESIRAVRSRHPFEILATVVLPDHLHAIWSLPPGDDRYPMRWRQIKRRFSETLRRTSPAFRPSPWARRYWEHTIRDEMDLANHIDYIHFNPVKHGLVQRVIDWPWSSFHRHVARGWLAAEWGGTHALDTLRAGE
jgi:putative transposase